MKHLRPIALLALASMIASAAFAGPQFIPLGKVTGAITVATIASGSRVTILPEVMRHLELARTYAQSGKVHEVHAHTERVLVGDEIKVAVFFDGVPMSRRDDCIKALESSLAEWERATKGAVRFTRTGGVPDVTVRFQPEVTMQGEQVAGHIRWRRPMQTPSERLTGERTKADVRIRTVTPSGRAMSVNAMRHAVMHEFGHVLGLEDSSSRDDIMGLLDPRNPNAGPRDYEANAVRMLREEARRILVTVQPKTRN
jgi:predicted Zn-dependent protease